MKWYERDGNHCRNLSYRLWMDDEKIAGLFSVDLIRFVFKSAHLPRPVLACARSRQTCRLLMKILPGPWSSMTSSSAQSIFRGKTSDMFTHRYHVFQCVCELQKMHAHADVCIYYLYAYTHSYVAG